VLFIITTIRPIFEYAHIDIFNSDLAFDVLRGFKNLNKKSFRVNVTTRENPNQDRFIDFRSDGSFRSGGEPYGPVNGSWEILPDKVLQITPEDNDEVGESTWKVTFDKSQMIWRGTGNATLERFEIFWVKG
jgi:hypothetical protein